MATESTGQVLPYTSGADFRTAQYSAVILTGTPGAVVLPTGANTHAIGILQNKPNIGEGAAVAISGKTKAIAFGAIPTGALVAPIASGQVQVAVSGQFPIGYCDDVPAASTGDIIMIVLHQGVTPLP